VRILLIEPYYTGSHRAWADGYARYSGHDVMVLTHGGAFWKWRMHGAHLTLAADAEQLIARAGPPDAVLAGSMLNLAGFLGATRRSLGAVPVAVYFHESQLGYPLSSRDRPDYTYPMINWTSAAVADRVLFNSAFHRDTFFAALPAFLRQFPDHHHAELVSRVRQRSEVLPVGVDLRRLDGPAGSRRGAPPLVVWNQRWEYDKGPAEIVALVEALVAAGRDFRLALLGERFVSTPEVFDRIPGLLGDRLVSFGFAAGDDYADLLRSADVVVSAAHQEFFGVAVTEAVYAGAFPVLPNALVYPERIPEAHHARSLYTGSDEFVAKVAWVFDHPSEAAAVAATLRPVMARSDWAVLATQYDEVLAAMSALRPE
jgi:glycosyltransferase involved in cell wall biosynthesis